MNGVVATPLASAARRHLSSTATWIVLSMLLAALSGFLLWPTGSRATLDPENSTSNGARAVAQVTQEHGVRITVVRSAAQLATASASLEGPATLVVTASERATASTGRAVAEQAPHFRHVVLVGLYQDVLTETGFPVRTAAGPGLHQTIASGCTTDVIGQAERIVNAGQWYGPEVAGTATTCFTAETAAKLVSLPPSGTRPAVDALSERSLMTNGEIVKESHAVLALRLLTRDPHLVWYSPDASELDPSETTPADTEPDLMPPWGQVALLMLGAVTLGAMLWRGRRLGRLVVEPLPVVVKAIETTRSRAQLYFTAHDTAHAAAVLQRTTRARLRTRLALAPDADPAALVSAVARATGRDPHQVGSLLFDPRTPDDTALVALANALATLEQEARP